MTREEFFSKYITTAKNATAGTRVFPSVVLSVAAHESNNGSSKLTREANNFFGIKSGSNWKGEAYKIETAEYENGEWIKVPAWFRKYDLPIDSFEDYVALISTADRYAPALQATNALDQLVAIKEAGYATDPGYVVKVAKVIDALKNFIADVKKKSPDCYQAYYSSHFWDWQPGNIGNNLNGIS